MANKACIYEAATILSEVDEKALIASYESHIKSGSTERQAFVLALSNMATATAEERADLGSHLNIEYEIKVPKRTHNFAKESAVLLDSELTKGSLAKDLLSNAMTPAFIRKKLSDFFSEDRKSVV